MYATSPREPAIIRRPAAAILCLLALLAVALPAQAIDRLRVWHDGREIDVVDRDGWAIYDGDIIVGRTAQVLERSRSEGPDGKRIGSLTAKSRTLGGLGRHWPRGASGLFAVPYVVETDPDGNVPAAVAAFNDSLSGFMRAVPRTNETDYVAFTLSATDTSGFCFSSVGRVGGRQIIQGSRLCAGGGLVHEMGHALGLYHEQQHEDSALFVQINLANVDPSRVRNYIPSVNQRSATPYDFASIMHYNSSGLAREGEQTLETIPPGVAIGQRVGFSAADLEGIRRLYGSPPQQVTVTSFPAGLTVLVDGVATATPATFNWGIGSSHVLDVPATAQTMNGAAHVFARWNVDQFGDLASRRVISVTAGDGTMTAPTTQPAVSTYTASFVRNKEVRLTTSGNNVGVGGSVVATPSPSALPGVTGTYYRERQAFTLDAVPNPGSLLGSWGGSYFYSVAHTTQYRTTFRGPVVFSDTRQTAYEYRASFVDFPLLSIRARSQDGEALGLRATVTRTGSASTDERLPYNGVAWTSGQAGTVSAAATQSPFAPTVRYVFLDWDGNPSPSIAVSSPALGQSSRTVTANFSKEYQAYVQVNPNCGGSITLPGDATAWYAHGSSVLVSLATNSGWVFAGWDGSLSGTAAVTNLAVDDVPNLIANLNTVGTPLAVTSVTPAKVASGVPVTLQITGTGFTPLTEVYVSGVREPSQFVSATQLTATATPADFPATGLAIVTVANRPGGTGTCSVSAFGKMDVIGNASGGAPVSGRGNTKTLGSRATVSTAATLYGGFALEESSLVYVLVRGNSLGTLGVTQGFLDAPRVRIYNSQGLDMVLDLSGRVGFNGCSASSTAESPVVNYYQNIRGQPAHARDACIAQTLPPGAYTFSVTPSIPGVTGTATSTPSAGEVLFEVTLGGGGGSIAKTLGSRATVSQAATLYGGFAIASSSVVYILVRGNSLGTLGVTQSYLDAPRVRIFDGQGRDLITDVNGNAGFGSCLATHSLQQPVFDHYRFIRGQPAESRDACVRQNLTPGVYSFSVTPSGVSLPPAGEVLFEVTLAP